MSAAPPPPAAVAAARPTLDPFFAAVGSVLVGQKRLVESIHTRRLGTPQDIANATLFFLSEQAGWISGQVLSVDGGRS